MSTFGGGYKISGNVNVEAYPNYTVTYTVPAASFIWVSLLPTTPTINAQLFMFDIVSGGYVLVSYAPTNNIPITGLVFGPGAQLQISVSTPGQRASFCGVLFSNG